MNKEFEVHLLNPKGVTKARKIAEEFDALLDKLSGTGIAEHALASSFPSREMYMVRTHLELASFYAKKAMASLAENQKS